MYGNLKTFKLDKRYTAHKQGFTHAIEICYVSSHLGDGDHTLRPRLEKECDRINGKMLWNVHIGGDYTRNSRVAYAWPSNPSRYQYFFRNEEDMAMVLMCL